MTAAPSRAKIRRKTPATAAAARLLPRPCCRSVVSGVGRKRAPHVARQAVAASFQERPIWKGWKRTALVRSKAGAMASLAESVRIRVR
jgi:hypothetical protein